MLTEIGYVYVYEDCDRQICLMMSSYILQENVFSETPLHAACTSGRSIELVAYLLRQPGVDPNCQGSDGHSRESQISHSLNCDIPQYLPPNVANRVSALREKGQTMYCY